MRNRLSIDVESEQKERMVYAAALHGVPLSLYVLEAVEMRLRAEASVPGTLAGSLKAYARPGLRAAEVTAWADSVAERP